MREQSAEHLASSGPQNECGDDQVNAGCHLSCSPFQPFVADEVPRVLGSAVLVRLVFRLANDALVAQARCQLPRVGGSHHLDVARGDDPRLHAVLVSGYRGRLAKIRYGGRLKCLKSEQAHSLRTLEGPNVSADTLGPYEAHRDHTAQLRDGSNFSEHRPPRYHRTGLAIAGQRPAAALKHP